MFSTTASASGSKSKQVVSLKIIAETRRIAIITRGGDITTIPLEEAEPVVCPMTSSKWKERLMESFSQTLKGQLNLESLPPLGHRTNHC